MRLESPIYFPPIDRELVRDNLARAIEHPEAVLVLIAERDSPVGFMVAFMAFHTFSRERLAVQELFYVLPDHRGTFLPAAMMRKFMAWAKTYGALHASASVHSSADPEKTGRFFQAFGFKFAGGHYMKLLR